MILHVRYVELVPDHDEGAALIGVQEAPSRLQALFGALGQAVGMHMVDIVGARPPAV